MRVAVVTVGDELLAGDITNTNAAWLADRLSRRGVAVRRIVTVPDEVSAIAEIVREYSETYDAVVVTGGLGPTHDDLTMEAVAAAFDREVIEHPDAVAWLEEHGEYAYSELVDGTADLPAGARALPNENGVAPGAVVENVYVLPGVPGEMRRMFESVAGEFTGEPAERVFLHVEEPESALVDRLREARERFDVTVGSYPGDGVRLKVQGTDHDAVHAARDWLRERMPSAVEVGQPRDDQQEAEDADDGPHEADG